MQNWLNEVEQAKTLVIESTESFTINSKPSLSWLGADFKKKYKLDQNQLFTAAKKEEEKELNNKKSEINFEDKKKSFTLFAEIPPSNKNFNGGL